MAETASSMLPLNTIAPNFTLYDVITEKPVSLDEVLSPVATVIMFICNHCPYVKHIMPTVVDLVRMYEELGVSFVGINSNDTISYPQDRPELMQEFANEYGFRFPYLVDATQTVAKAYHAECTPDFYIFNCAKECVYRGRFDNATPRNNHPVTGNDLKKALDEIIAKTPVSEEQIPSLGCNIKWKKK